MPLPVRRVWYLCLLAACIGSSGPLASAADAASPIVPAFERFSAAPSGDVVAGGRLLWGELNCSSCHALTAQQKRMLTPKQAPVLDEVGSRVRPDYLRAFLRNPHQTKPGTTMPDVLAHLPEAQRHEQVEALVHFLVQGGTVRDTYVARQSIARGEELFHRTGCVGCHDAQRGSLARLPTSVPLPELAQKYTASSLAAFLRDPLQSRPSGRMPSLNLSDQEARDIAAYFLKDVKVQANIAFKYYEGSWDKLPDFDKLQPAATGQTPDFSVSAASRSDYIGLRLEAYFQVPKDGNYTFHLGSDDGSRLYLDGRLLIDHDGTHAYSEKSAKAVLAKGPHPVRVEFFEHAGGEELRVEFEGAGMSRQPLAGHVTLEPQPAPQPTNQFQVDSELARRGKELFVRSGCVACHSLKGVPPFAATPVPPPLSELHVPRGCLSEQPPAPLPRYGLNARQRRALSAAIAALQGTLPAPGGPEAARALVTHALASFNCYACHTRGGVGGVEPARDAFFETTTPEMGDEGRIPPHLDGVGDKLTPAYLNHLLFNGAKDRPYMLTRMPKFGGTNVAELAAAFATLDLLPAAPLPHEPEPKHRLKSIGRFLVGGKSLSCIKCHTFGNYEATGIQSISLTIMTHRLREDWFYRYLLNPAQYRPGTRMPSPWPNGQSLLPTILDGDALRQMRAVWTYLADGTKAGVPLGLERASIELVPENEAIIYRNFIEGAGPRAIGVGYPQKVNLAFDAENVRLALIWQGAFIDAAKHWNDRGAGFQVPLGDNVVSFPNSVSFATLPDDQAAWPQTSAREQGYQFRGYKLVGKSRAPIMMYTLKDMSIEDHFQPLESTQEPGFRRVLTLRGQAPPGLYFRAAAGDIQANPDGWHMVNDALRIRVAAEGTDAAPRLRQASGGQELLLPVDLSRGAVTIIQDLRW